MPSVAEVADEILAREGGYVDDPDDPGGPTNHGVTIQTMRRLGLDLDGDGKITRADVRALSRKEARNILIRNYFETPGIGGLPTALQASVFDMQVNAGAEAVRILQRLLDRMVGPVAVDGRIGPVTRAAAARAAGRDPVLLADAYGIARRNYYYRLGDRRPELRKFARRRDGGKGGWITRAEVFIRPRFHLSDAAHRERTVSWA